MRQVLSTAITALIVAALTAVTVSALAQDTPTTERTISPAAVSNINAHRVDGKHAVGFTNKPLARRNKLVATNKQGLLPSNIVQPLWGTIKNKPAGFADGIDNEGVTGISIKQVIGAPTSVAASSWVSASVDCPAGSVPTGGGGYASSSTLRLTDSYPELANARWRVYYYNEGAFAANGTAYVLCMTTPSVPISVASKGVAPAAKKGR